MSIGLNVLKDVSKPEFLSRCTVTLASRPSKLFATFAIYAKDLKRGTSERYMRLRFTIRDLLWLSALVALALGWNLDHSRVTSRKPPPAWASVLIEDGQVPHPHLRRASTEPSSAKLAAQLELR